MARWRNALAGLDHADWRSDERWRSLTPPNEESLQALEALKAKLGDGAGEYALLRELALLKTSVRERVLARLSSLERERPSASASTFGLLASLRSEIDSTAVLLEGDHWSTLQVTPTSIGALTVLIGLLSYVASTDFSQRFAALLVACTASLIAAFVLLRAAVLRPTSQVVVSRDSVHAQLNGQWVKLRKDQLHRLRIRRRDLAWDLSFELSDPTLVSPSLRLRTSPAQLAKTLRANGFDVDDQATDQHVAEQNEEMRELEAVTDAWRQGARGLRSNQWRADPRWWGLERGRGEKKLRKRFEGQLELERLMSIQANVRSLATKRLIRLGEKVGDEEGVHSLLARLQTVKDRTPPKRAKITPAHVALPAPLVVTGLVILVLMLLILSQTAHP